MRTASNNLRQANTPWRTRGGGPFRSDPGSGFVLRFLQLLVLSLLVGVTPLAGAFVITRTSAPVFYIDTSVIPTIREMMSRTLSSRMHWTPVFGDAIAQLLMSV